jgi:hypothetical protein
MAITNEVLEERLKSITYSLDKLAKTMEDYMKIHQDKHEEINNNMMEVKIQCDRSRNAIEAHEKQLGQMRVQTYSILTICIAVLGSVVYLFIK